MSIILYIYLQEAWIHILYKCIYHSGPLCEPQSKNMFMQRWFHLSLLLRFWYYILNRCSPDTSFIWVLQSEVSPVELTSTSLHASDLTAGMLAEAPLFLREWELEEVLVEELCLCVSMCVCVFKKSLCISDWSGSWSGPIRSHGRSPSSVLLSLVHLGVTFCSTSSTGRTTVQ